MKGVVPYLLRLPHPNHPEIINGKTVIIPLIRLKSPRNPNKKRQWPFGNHGNQDPLVIPRIDPKGDQHLTGVKAKAPDLEVLALEVRKAIGL